MQHDNNNNKKNNLKYEPSAKTNNELACIEKPMKMLCLSIVAPVQKEL